MKKIIILSLILSSLVSRSQKMDDDKLHYIAGYGISAFCGYSMYHLTNRAAIGSFIGPLMGFTAGNFKEDVWDKTLKRGVFSSSDRFTTWWGSLVGGITLRVEIDVEQKQNLQTYRYENLR